MSVMIIDMSLCDLCDGRTVACVKACTAKILSLEDRELKVAGSHPLKSKEEKVKVLDSRLCQACRYCRTECPKLAIRFR